MDFLTTNKELLDEKKAQTTYKIEYVSKYVEKWLFVMSNVDEVKNINFIDLPASDADFHFFHRFCRQP